MNKVDTKEYKSPKRLLFFSHSSDLAGAERSLLELVNELVNDYNTRCMIVLPSHGKLEGLLNKTGANVVIGSINWWCAGAEYPTNEIVNQKYIQSLSWLQENLHVFSSFNPDVVLTNTIVIPTGALAASLLKRPHIWMINEYGELDHQLNFFLPFPQILRIIENASDKIVTCSKSVREQLFNHLDCSKVKTIYYNIEIPKDISNSSNSRVIKDNYFIHPDACHMIISGTIMKSKGQEDAIYCAIELLKNRKRKIELIVVGPSQPDYQNYLQDIIDDNEVGDYIHIIPYQDNVLSIVDLADIVLVCSRMEAFGRVTLEAMLMKKVVIGTNTGGTPEMIIDSETGLLYNPTNYLQLAGNVEKILDNPEFSKNLAYNGYQFAKNTFSKENFGGKYFEILEEIEKEKGIYRDEFSWFLSTQYINYIQDLNKRLVENKKTYEEQKNKLEENDQSIRNQLNLISERDETIQIQTNQIAEREQTVQSLTAQVVEHEKTVQTLTDEIAEKEQHIQTLSGRIKEKEQEVQALVTKVSEKESIAQILTNQLNQTQNELTMTKHEVLKYALSKSWRITRPLRKVGKLFRGKSND